MIFEKYLTVTGKFCFSKDKEEEEGLCIKI